MSSYSLVTLIPLTPNDISIWVRLHEILFLWRDVTLLRKICESAPEYCAHFCKSQALFVRILSFIIGIGQ